MANMSFRLIVLFLPLSGIMLGGLCKDSSAKQPLGTHYIADKTLSGVQTFVPSEILVKFHSDVPVWEIHAMNKVLGMTILEINQGLVLYRMRVSKSVQDTIILAQTHTFVETARPNYILAEVAGEIITLLDVESAVQGIPAFLRGIYMRPEGKESLLRTLVDYKLFAKAAKERDLDEIPEIKRKIDATIEKTLAEVFLRNIFETTSISEKELSDYYDTHLKEFRIPEQIKIRQIVVETEEEAREIAEALKVGAEFEKIARERSIGSTAQWGGELGWFGRGRLDPALEITGFSLEKGEISGIIKTSSGYNIIKLEEKRSARRQSFSDVRNRIKKILQERRQKEIREQERRELGKRYGVTLHREFLPEIEINTAEEAGHQDPIPAFQEIFERHY